MCSEFTYARIGSRTPLSEPLTPRTFLPTSPTAQRRLPAHQEFSCDAPRGYCVARRARSALFCFLPRRRGIIDRQHQLAQKLLTEARPCTIDRRTSREHQRVQQRAGSVLFKSRTTPPGRPRRPSWPFNLSAAASARSRSSSRTVEGHRPRASVRRNDHDPCTSAVSAASPLLLQQLPLPPPGTFNLG